MIYLQDNMHAMITSPIVVTDLQMTVCILSFIGNNPSTG